MIASRYEEKPSLTAIKTDSLLFKNLQDYMPIVFAGLLIILLTCLDLVLIGRSQMVMFGQIMNIFMGFYFIVYGIPKLFNIQSFTKSFKKYDFISRRFPIYGYMYPFIEIVLGLLYVFGVAMNSLTSLLIVNGFVIIISSAGVIGVTKSLRSKTSTTCSCLGSIFKMPLSKVALFENLLMLIMGITMVVSYKSMIGMV